MGRFTRVVARICDRFLGERVIASLAVPVIVGAVALLYGIDIWSGLVMRDSGVFLYVGDIVRHGGAPYGDVWDHKGVLIYLLNALGAALTPNAGAGVLILDATGVAAAFLLLYRLLTTLFSAGISLLAVLSGFAGFMIVYDQGNLTETFALLGQVVALWVFFEYLRRRRVSSLLMLGAAAAWCAWLRLTLAATPLGLALALLFIRPREPASIMMRAAIIGLGFLAPSIALVLYLYAVSAIGPAIDQFLAYNFAYVQASPDSRISSLLALLGQLAPNLTLGLVACGVAAVIHGARASRPRFAHANATAVGLLAALTLECSMVTISGRGYHHYAVSLLPIFVVLSAYGIDGAAHLLTILGVETGQRALGLALGVVQLVVPINRVASDIAGLQSKAIAQRAVVSEIRALTAKNDTVLVYGNDPALNFLADRRAPTRYVYQYPLITLGYAAPQMVQEFIEQVSTHPPGLIVDVRNPRFSPLSGETPLPTTGDLSNVTSLAAYRAGYRSDTTTLAVFRAWVTSHYSRTGSVPYLYGNVADFYLPIRR